MTRKLPAQLLGCVLVFGTASVHAAAVASDGSDGAYIATVGSNVIDLTLAGREDGVLNFTTITVPFGATVTFKRNAANTPVYLAATGAINIFGTIDVSARGGFAGPGGGEGGAGGFGDAACTASACHPAEAGGGVLGGNAGPNASVGGDQVHARSCRKRWRYGHTGACGRPCALQRERAGYCGAREPA